MLFFFAPEWFEDNLAGFGPENKFKRPAEENQERGQNGFSPILPSSIGETPARNANRVGLSTFAGSRNACR